MQKVIVTDEVNRIPMSSDRGDWTLVKQVCQLHQGEGLGFRFEIAVPRNQSPYTPGEYYLHPDSFERSRYGDLQVNGRNIKLLQVPEKAKASA